MIDTLEKLQIVAKKKTTVVLKHIKKSNLVKSLISETAPGIQFYGEEMSSMTVNCDDFQPIASVKNGDFVLLKVEGNKKRHY